MSGKNFRKLLSAILASTMALGLMVIILEEGPTEMPYFDGSTKNPVTSPNIAALYQTGTEGTAAQTSAISQPIQGGSVAYQTQAEYPPNNSYTPAAQ